MYFKYNNIIAAVTLAAMMVSCEKEYSYENGSAIVVPVDSTDTVAAPDTFVTGTLQNCTACTASSGIATGTWSFKTGVATICGEVDTAFTLNHERDVLTFFGPSFCGSDSGLIFTVNLSTGLTRNLVNIPATFTAYYYYRTGHPNILLSYASQPFNMLFSSYDHATHIANGTFSGTAYSQNGTAVNISGGKFSFVIR